MTEEDMERLLQGKTAKSLISEGALFRNRLGRSLIVGLTVEETDTYLGIVEHVHDHPGGTPFYRAMRTDYIALQQKIDDALQAFRQYRNREEGR